MQRRDWVGLSTLILVTMLALGGCSNGGNNSNLTTTPTDPTTPSGVGFIQGIVRNYDTNAAIAGATIRVFDSSENDLGTETTDAEGNFQ